VPLSGTIIVTDTDIYDNVGPVLQLPGLCNMGRLIQLDGGQVSGAFAGVGEFLTRIRLSGLLDDAIPLVEGISVGTAAKIDQAWEDHVLSIFKPSGEKEAPSTITQLLDRLAPVLGATQGRYNKTECTLELDFDFSRALGESDEKLRFDAKLGGLAEVAAAGNIKVSGVAGLKFTLGFDLDYLVGNDFELNAATTLESLGIGPNETAFQGEPDFRITLSTGEQYTVEVSPTWTVGQLLAAINTKAPDRLVAEIEPRRQVTVWLNDAAKSRLVFDVDPADDDAAVKQFVEDYVQTALKFTPEQVGGIRIVHVREAIIIREKTAAGGQGGLKLERLNDSRVASVLGIDQSTDTADADGDYPGRLVIRGPALMQRSLADSIYLVASDTNAPQIIASVEAKTADLSALANIGIADITVSQGEATARLAATLKLADPGTDPESPGRITLAEMIDATTRAARDISFQNLLGGLNGNYVIDASASVRLPVKGNVLGKAIDAPNGVTASWAKSWQGETPDIDIVGWWKTSSVAFDPQLLDLADLRSLTAEDIVRALRSFVEYLKSAGVNVPALGVKLPIIDRSLGDIISADGVLEKLVAAFEKSPGKVLAEIEAALNKALGLKAGEGVNLTLANKVFGIKFQLTKPIDVQQGVDIDLDYFLKDKNLANTLGRFVDAQGKAAVTFSGTMEATIDLGIDLADPENPRPFVFTRTGTAGTGVKFTVAARAEKIEFSAAVGSLGVSTLEKDPFTGKPKGGWIVLDANGKPGITGNEDPQGASIEIPVRAGGPRGPAKQPGLRVSPAKPAQPAKAGSAADETTERRPRRRKPLTFAGLPLGFWIVLIAGLIAVAVLAAMVFLRDR
jgi:hypothetical protein